MDNWLRFRAKWDEASRRNSWKQDPLGTAGSWLGLAAYSLYTVILWIYGKLFAYSLRPMRALGTFAACVIIGWFGVYWANRVAEVLMVDTSPIAFAVEDNRVPRMGTVVFPIGRLDGMMPVAVSADEIACGNEIDHLLYAVDVFIPLIDLRQESECHVSNDAVIWGWTKAGYAVIGWIVTSLTILTVAGVAQRKIGG